LLLPLTRQAARLAADEGRTTRWPALVGLVAVNQGMIAINRAEVTSVWFLWVAPTLLAMSVAVELRLPRGRRPAVVQT
jgi:hypothetical protein